jgi:ABC-type polysaccharide transport system permease subunit
MVRVLGNTLAMSFLSVACSVLPIVFAIMITELRFSFVGKIVQSATTLPNFISWVIVYSLAYTMFSSDGVVNQILLNIGVISRPTNILGNNGAVWMFQTALGVWKTLGWNAIIYLAAIAGIDDELYDAADIDGAGRLGKIRYITLPGVAPTFFVLLLLAISNILSAGFEQYLVFYNSLVADKIEVIDYYVYRIGIITNDYSYGTAIGMTKSVVSVLLLFLANLLSKKVRGSSII